MNITHHGGRYGVTGSCHEVKLTPTSSILIDCGLTQGAETTTETGGSSATFITFPVEPIKAVILTHIHIDHCGRLPYLLGAGYRGKIYCSEASALLLPLVLEDALKLGITRDADLIKRFLAALRKHLVPLSYGEWREVGTWEGAAAKVRLQQAGHILGSAVVELDVQGSTFNVQRSKNESPSNKPVASSVSGYSTLNLEPRTLNGSYHLKPVRSSAFDVRGLKDEAVSSSRIDAQKLSETAVRSSGDCLSSAFESKTSDIEPRTSNSSYRLVFSGDLGAPDTPLLPDPAIPERADILLMESTYGDRLHEDRKNRKERLRSIIRRAVKNRGAILIPAFSIGRTQELLYELEALIAEHRDEEVATGLAWDDLEVVVDSPMAQKITDIYAELQPLWDAEAKSVVAAGRHPLSFEQMTVIGSHEEHLQTVSYLKKSARPCIVIAAGGMCAGGRIVNYLKALLDDDRTDVLFVGYQAEGTPGREIQEAGAGGIVCLDGKNCRIRAAIHTISGYSAHADQQNLVDFVKAMPQKPRMVRLIHGETMARASLAKKLRGEVGVVVKE